VRIIKPARILEFAKEHPDAREALDRWLHLAALARWTSLADIRKVFRTADEVKVKSGRPVVIFNIRGNNYRLITAVHYNREMIFVMAFLTHAEYSKDTWKKLL
jgi:mRNA interferase HigB